MSKKTEIEEAQSIEIESKLSSFLARNTKALVGLVVAVVAVIIILIVVNTVNNKTANEKFTELSNVQTEYSTAITADSTTDNYQANIDAAVAKLVALEDVSGYVGDKATYLVATNSFNNKDYATALEDFLRISEEAKGTYLGSLSLSNAIACEEELGDDAKVIELCQSLLDTYGNDAAESPRTMFTLARTYESQGEAKLAQSQFQQLADQFPSSEYGKLALNSLLKY
jgi:tetratricopeptide (TPR) repeat protein